jgi:uncharacterized protein (TIGR00730 family)
MKIKSLAVFCGSKDGNNPSFVSDAKALGGLLAGNDIALVYGGGNKGLMGVLANAMLEKGGTVTGIIPKVLLAWEAQHEGITELIVAEDMHSRKKMLYEKCDAALVLPGGFGTLDELFEILTWNQLNIHDKQIFILNTAGFYDHLIAHLKMLENENFLYDRVEDRITVINTVADITGYL